MLFKTISGSVYGIDAYPVEVEIDVGSAYMKDFNVVGLPDNALKESRERIKSALRNCGFEFPYGQGVTINLAPADLRKEGSGFDLPMALGVVGCHGQFFGKMLDQMMFLGELSLDGSVRPVRRAYHSFAHSDQRSALLLEATAIEMLYQLPWKHAPKAECDTPRWLKDVVEILHAEFSRPFSLAAIAQRVAVHPVYLARTFRRRYGMTVGQYVRKLRVDYAMNALVGEDSLSDIATRAGFSDQSHLGRVFRMATGRTPRQFRLAHQRPS